MKAFRKFKDFNKNLFKKSGKGYVAPENRLKKKYEVSFNYIEDVEYPSKWQRFVMIIGNAYWYNMILGIAFVTTLFALHLPILGDSKGFDVDGIQFMTVVVLFECFYIFDIILTCIAQYIMKLEFHNEGSRPLWILLFEIISCFPFKMDKFAGVFRALCAIRLFHHFYRSRASLHVGIKTRVVQFFCSITICESVYSWIYFVCSDKKSGFGLYIRLFEVASAQIVGKGGIVSHKHHYSESIYTHEVPLSFTSLLFMFIILKPTLCDIIALLTLKYENKFKYIYKVNFFEEVMTRRYRTSPNSKRALIIYLENYWKERQGWMRNEQMDRAIQRIFPHALYREMCLDCAYDMFRHSQILRDLEIPVMRYLALKIKNRLYMKGDYVYNRTIKVDYMIYVHRGRIDILSSENGETGIISLTTGTVLGETALFYPFKSKVNIRCQTTTEIYVLERKDFMQLTRYYPDTFQIMKRIIKSRLILGEKILSAKKRARNTLMLTEQIVWLKAMLHHFSAMDPNLKNLHLMKNIFLAPFLERILRKQDPMLHTLRYMELLSIKGRNDVNYDLVFVRKQCLWILQYDSPIYGVWDFCIAVTAFLMALIQPYNSIHEYNAVFMIIITSTYFLFLIDLLLSFITPISAKSTANTFTEIFYERFSSLGLYLDICSIIYFPFFAHAFPFAKSDSIFIMHAIKVWKVYRMFNKWEKRFKLNLLLQKYCVFIFSFFIYVYTLGYILYLDKVITSPFSPIGFQISTGVGFKIANEPLKSTILYAFINSFAVIFESIGIVSVTSANYMQYTRKSRIYNALERLKRLTKRNPHSKLFKRLNSFLATQINDNAGFTCAFDINRFYDWPAYYSELLKAQMYIHALKDLEFFKLVPREIVKRISGTASVSTYHRHALILSYGTADDYIYILLKGEARLVYGNKFYRVKPFMPLNLLEVLFDIPCVSNCVGITEVTVVSFKYKTFLDLLKQYNVQERALQITIDMNRAEVTQLLYKIFSGPQVVIMSKIKEFEQTSFNRFDTGKMIEDSLEEADYFIPFEKIYPFGFLRHILMKKTILPDGRFLFYWELARCILGYIASLVFFIPPLSLQSYNHPFTLILFALDFTALLDMYVRFHVCYYEDNGILVTHPLRTASNYLYKAFCMDLLGMLPLYLLIADSPHYKILANLLHLLQLHRLIGFKKHYFYTTYSFDYIFIVMTITSPMNLVSCLIFMIDCYDWQNEENPVCQCKSFKKDSPLGNYITINYFIMSTLTCSGTGSVVDLENVENTFILNLISICSFISTFIRIYVTAYLFGSYNKMFSGAYKLRDNIKRLVSFLRKENVRPYLRKQIKIYYELYWHWLHQINPICLTHNLNPALRRDMIYSLFGEHMHCNAMIEDISNRMRNFYKNMLNYAKPLIIPKNGYILTINDVHSDIYLICKGSVDVVSASGGVLETITDGAFLGNLENKEYSRQSVSFVTNTVTKLLHIKTTEFYRIMRFFPAIRTSFFEIKNRKFYYVPSTYVEDEYERAQWAWTPQQLRQGYKRYHMYHVLSWIHFVFPCCIGLTMELYQIAMGEVYIVYIVVQYIFDFIHLVHQYLKFYMPYMTREQEFVMHPLRIKAHSMKRRRYLYKLYFINLPLDLPFLIFCSLIGIPLQNWSLVFSFLRLNRLSRWVNIAHIYSNGTQKVASFSKGFKLWILFLLLFFSTQTIATIIAVSDFVFVTFTNATGSQIISEMPVEDLRYIRFALWTDKLGLYAHYWFLSVLLHTFNHDDLYYPKQTYFESLFIVIFLYVTIFESFVMVHYYKILMESTTLVKVIHSIRRYIEVYFRISSSSYVLQERVEEAINHYYSLKIVCDDYLLHKNCPRYLHEACMMSIYGYLFKSHPYFRNAHPDMLRQMTKFMRNVAYPVNCTIVNRMDCLTTLYFVHRGEVAAVRYDNDSTAHAEYIYSKGDSFGFEAAFKGLPFSYTYRTISFCEIVELDWFNCAYLLDFFPFTSDQIQKTHGMGIKHHIQSTGQDVRARRRRL